jgi:hypothetical protein
MSDFHRRLHGDETLDDPELAGKLCPKCIQRRNWIIVHETDDDYVKKCAVCGTTINVKKVKPPPKVNLEQKPAEILNNFNNSVNKLIKKVGSYLGFDEK